MPIGGLKNVNSLFLELRFRLLGICTKVHTYITDHEIIRLLN